MASLRCSACPSPSILGFRRPRCRPSATVIALGINAPPAPLNFSFKNVVRLQLRQSSLAVFASNADTSDQDSLVEKSDGIKSGDAGQGPPLLTILAGLLVFFLIFWIIGSIVIWLISLVGSLPPSK